MRTYTLSMLLYLLFFYSCSPAGNRAYFAEVQNKQPESIITSLDLDTFRLDSVYSSYVGFLDIKDDKILLVDQKICDVFFFDKDGRLLKQKLGQGPGPNELATGMIAGYAFIDNGYLFVGGGNDCHLYDENFNLRQKYVIDKGSKEGKTNYDAPWIYTLAYQHLQMKSYSRYLYYTVFSEYDDMNFIDSPKEYFANAHYLAKMDLHSGAVERMLGKYPPVYASQRNLKQFSFINFDIKASGDFIVSFEGDSLIYEYDKDFMPLRTYGYAGKDIEFSDRVLGTFSDFQKYYEQDREKSGYYCELKYVDDTATLLRSYRKGGNARNDGLQIYRDGVLIGDVEVPAGFKVLGYIAPYYYATCGINEEREEVEILKFKI